MPASARGPGDRLAVVPGARRDDAAAALLRRQLRDRVVRAADLERARALQVLGLEQDRATGETRQGLRRVHGRHARDAVQPFLRGAHVVDGGTLAHGARSPVTVSTTAATAVTGSTSRRWTPSTSAAHVVVLAHRLPYEPPEPCDGERLDLAAQVALASRVELAALVELGPALLERVPELGHALAAERLGEQDRRPPLANGIERDDRPHLLQHRLRRGVVHLVDGDHVGDLHDPRLERLHCVTGAGHQHEQDDVCDADHLDLALAGADRLEEDDVLPGCVDQQERLERRFGQAAEVPARAHRADVDLRVEEVVGEADAVAEQRAARERARRVDGDDADAPAEAARMADERADERRLADARRPGDADRRGATRARVDPPHDLGAIGLPVLHEGDRAGERAPVSGEDAGDELVLRPAAALPSER